MRLARAVVWTLTLAAVATVGCKKDAASPVDPAIASLSHTSGQRLRARVFVSGSVETFVGWFDTVLGVPCFFEKAEDGELRCLPIPPPGTPSVFCDSTVIAEAIDPPQRCPEELYADGYAPEGGSCGPSPGTSVYVAGGVLESPTMCTDGPFQAPGTYEPHSASHLPPSTFTRAYETVVTVGTRLAQHVIVSDDGAREVVSIFDPTIGEDCTPAGSECVPSAAAFAGTFFSDAACSGADPIIATVKGCLLSRYAATGDGCTLSYVSVGAAIDATTLYLKNDRGCTSIDADASTSYFAAGAPVSADAFAAVTEVTIGTGRVVAKAAADAQGVPLRLTGELEDTQVGASCHATRVDGVERCVPDSYASVPREPLVQVYADAACTRLLASNYGGSCAPPQPPPSAVRVATSACDSELHAVGELFTGPTFAIASGACKPSTVGSNEPRYLVGARIASDSLAEIALVTE